MIYDEGTEKLILKYENDIIKVLSVCLDEIDVIVTIYNSDVIGTDIFSDRELIYSEIYKGYELERSNCDDIDSYGLYNDVVKEYVKFYEKLKDYKLQLQK